MLSQPNLCMLVLVQHVFEQERPNRKTSKPNFSEHKHAMLHVMLHDHAHGMVFLLVLTLVLTVR